MGIINEQLLLGQQMTELKLSKPIHVVDDGQQKSEGNEPPQETKEDAQLELARAR
jgi:hypothetical protein